MRQITAALLVLAGVSAAQPALAFFDPPWITPANPTAGEIVSVNIRGGICDSIFERPGYPQITQTDGAIRILEYGHHWDFEDFCIYDVGTLTRQIGAFPPGDYILTVDFTYSDFLPTPTIVTLGVIPFTVTGTAAVATPVPALTPIGSLALSMLLGLSAWLWHVRRTASRR